MLIDLNRNCAVRTESFRTVQYIGMRSTPLQIAWAKRPPRKALPEKVGRCSKRVDAALPGKHTRLLYGRPSRTEAGVLAQLRTGMAKLTDFHRIKAALSDQCAGGQARETVDQRLPNQGAEFVQGLAARGALASKSLGLRGYCKDHPCLCLLHWRP